MIKKMKMCFYRKSIDYMSVCMIWSMAQSDAYKHGALSVILQSGQQRLLGVTLCHSDPTQTHRTLPDLLSLDINRCLFLGGGLWATALERHWSLYSVYSLSCTTSSPSCHQCLHFSLCCTHCTQDRLSRTTHSHLTQLLPIVGWWGNDVSVWLTKKSLLAIYCVECAWYSLSY